MKLTETSISGVVKIDLTPIEDDRGFFARSFCTDTLKEAGIAFDIVQANLSRNFRARTLRGMHYQDFPTPDPKIVRCERGSIFDVAVDLRPASPTFKKWVSAELSAENGSALCIPEGCAHGFISLIDDSQVQYFMGAPFVAELARGVRWNDPAFGIEWPIEPDVIANRDSSYPDFEAE